MFATWLAWSTKLDNRLFITQHNNGIPPIMRPVERNDVRRLTNRNTILILDLASWTIAYIDNIISRNPKNIATKQGSKTLPPELWYMILSWAEDDFAEPGHKLVYPVEITSVQLDGETSEPAMVCNEIPQWWRFGAIRNRTELIYYENYLISPWHLQNSLAKRIVNDSYSRAKVWSVFSVSGHQSP
jgi:hypothetical protein